MKAEQEKRMPDEKMRLELGRSYMLDAEQSELESDYIAAEGMYHICCELFSGLMQQFSVYGREAAGEYMHALFRYASLPQIDSREKVQYLNQAYELAVKLERETGELEYTIAMGCMEEEIEELNKNIERQVSQKQWDVISF